MDALYKDAIRADALATGACVAVGRPGGEVLICRTTEGFFAVDAICTHADARLDEGRLRGTRLSCPLHGAVFDVRDGRVLRGPACVPLRSYPCRVTGTSVEIAVSPGAEPTDPP